MYSRGLSELVGDVVLVLWCRLFWHVSHVFVMVFGLELSAQVDIFVEEVLVFQGALEDDQDFLHPEGLGDKVVGAGFHGVNSSFNTALAGLEAAINWVKSAR